MTTVNNQPLLRIGPEVQPPCGSRSAATVGYVVPYPFLPQLVAENTRPGYYNRETGEVAPAYL